MSSGIYSIEVNNKIYIGSAIKLDQRIWQHKSHLRKNKHHNIHLQRAYNKYGEIAFSFKIIQFCEPEKLIELEQNWIDWFNSCDPKFGYNIAIKAGSNLGKKMSEEAKIKMRKPRSQEFRKTMSQIKKGTKQSADLIEKRIAPLRGRKRSSLTAKDYSKKSYLKNYQHKGMPHKYFSINWK